MYFFLMNYLPKNVEASIVSDLSQFEHLKMFGQKWPFLRSQYRQIPANFCRYRYLESRIPQRYSGIASVYTGLETLFGGQVRSGDW
jgi:hypothetical protein